MRALTAALILIIPVAAFAPASAENIYWTEGTSGIHRANLDGSDVQQLTESDFAISVAVDPSADAMFWSERSGLMRSRLDGTDIELIKGGLVIREVD